MSRLIQEDRKVLDEVTEESSSKRSKKKRLLPSLMNGDLLTRDNLINNMPFIFFITFILICYIGYGYYVDKTSRSLAGLEEESRDLKAEKNNEGAYYNQMSMYSRIADSTAAMGLEPSVEPPVKIKVSPFEFNTGE